MRQKLRHAALLEYGRVEFDGEKILPAECARRIAAEREQHGWIPGAVSESCKCPLRQPPVKRLYRINAELTAEDRALRSGPLPSLDQLPSTKDFISYFDKYEALDKKIPEESKSYWERDSVSVVALERLKHHLTDALEGMELDARWFMACVQAGGEGGDRTGTWLELIDLIRTSRDEVAKKEKLVVRLGPSIRSTLSVQDQIRILQEIILHLKSPKQFKKLKSLFHPEWTRLTQEAKTDQGELKEIEHFEAVLHLVEVQQLRDNVRKRWDRQMEGMAAQASQEMGRKTEEPMSGYAATLEKAAKWTDERWGALKGEMAELALKWEPLCNGDPLRRQ